VTLIEQPSRRAAVQTPRLTGELVDFIARTDYDALPESVRHATRRIILDTVAVTVGGFDTPVAKALLELKRDQGGRPDATLVVEGTKLPAPSVAYIHAQLANLLDADDTFLNRGHFALASVVAALAVGEMVGASGEEIIAAVAVGFDLNARVCLSMQLYRVSDDGELIYAPLFGWSWMTFGAAAAAAKLLGLDRTQIANALGQAYVTSPVVYSIPKQNEPFYEHGRPANWHRYQMSGAATEAGINAALLARGGFSAQRDIFDEDGGFWRSFGTVGCDWELMYAGLGERWYIAETAIKPYPFCRFGHAALDVFTGIVTTNGLTAEAIDEVVVRIPPFEQLQQIVENVEVEEPLKLFVSLPTAFALIVDRVPPGPKWWKVDVTSPQLRAFAHKVRCEINREWSSTMAEQLAADGLFRRIPTEVIVRSAGGEYSGYAESARGDSFEPEFAMTDAELADKVRRFTEGFLPPDKAEALIASVHALGKGGDITAVADAMRR
jgi:2-methylcitrate dehydratase PrpD